MVHSLGDCRHSLESDPGHMGPLYEIDDCTAFGPCSTCHMGTFVEVWDWFLGGFWCVSLGAAMHEANIGGPRVFVNALAGWAD